MKEKGKRSEALVELVDLYPTLAEFAGLPLPDGLEGSSLVPLLDDPDREWKSAAFSQFRKTINGIPCMGYTMRTHDFRYTEWRNRNNMDRVVARELYDHRRDDDENENVAGNVKYAKIVEELAEKMKAGWKATRPM